MHRVKTRTHGQVGPGVAGHWWRRLGGGGTLAMRGRRGERRRWPGGVEMVVLEVDLDGGDGDCGEVVRNWEEEVMKMMLVVALR